MTFDSFSAETSILSEMCIFENDVNNQWENIPGDRQVKVPLLNCDIITAVEPTLWSVTLESVRQEDDASV